MARPYTITALDIGTGTIKILSVQKIPGEPDFEILGQGQEAALGIRRGVVVDPNKVAEAIASLVEKVEKNINGKVDSVYASFGGGHIFCTPSRGLVSVSRADRKISDEDIDRVIHAAETTLPLKSNQTIIQVFPREYIVDGHGKIRQAVGMEGVRLEADVLAACCFTPYLNNSKQAILDSGLEIGDLTPAPLASARAVLTPREKELGVVVLDIGTGTTDMAVFEEGNLIHTAVFPVGSGHITKDLAIALKTDIDIAERIKLEFGRCPIVSSKKKKNGKEERKIPIEGEEPLIFTQKELEDIIGARVSEIFDFANKDLKKISRQGILPAGIVLTGGGAKLPRIKETARKELGLPCRIGAVREFASLPQDPGLSTVCGLILSAVDFEDESAKRTSGLGRKISKRIKKLLKVFIP